MSRKIIFLRQEKPNDKYRSLFIANGFQVEFHKVLETIFVQQGQLEFKLNEMSFGGLIVTSQNAVEAIRKIDPAKWPIVYTVGPATADLVKAKGLNSVGECGNAAELADYILSTYNDPKPLLFLTGDKTKDILPIKLKNAGIELDELQVYSTTNLTEKLSFRNEIIVLFSPSGLDSIEINDNVWISIGPTTTSALQKLGINPHQATSPSPKGVLDAANEYLNPNK
ncbi:hypothetical protein HDV01_006467 [Terramyces sp. JEL0728]|nr:hypothetical protein HDV01_006467 [Terramyces sp. JEL0728]